PGSISRVGSSTLSPLASSLPQYRRLRPSATAAADLTLPAFAVIAPPMDDFDPNAFETALATRAIDVERMLDRLLGPALLHGELGGRRGLFRAIRDGVLNGGERLRLFVLGESAALFGAGGEAALRAAAALHCVPCASLIHDDLPAMDDDDLRRGEPT